MTTHLVLLFAALPILEIPAPSLRSFSTVELSSDDRFLINTEGNRLEIWDLASQSIVRSRTFPDMLSIGLDYDAKRRLLAVALGRTVEILREDTLETLRTFTVDTFVRGATFSPGDTLTISFGTGTMSYWVPLSGGEPRPLSPERFEQMLADGRREEAAHPTDKRLENLTLACVDYKRGATAELVDWVKGKRKVVRLRPGSENCRSIRLSPSGRVAAELLENGGVILHDLNTLTQLRRFENPVRPHRAELSPDGRILLSTFELMMGDGWSTTYTEAWDLAIMQRRFRIEQPYGVERALFRKTKADGPYDEVYLGWRRSLARMRLSDGKILASIDKVEDLQHTSLRLTPDGTALIVDRVANASSRRLDVNTLAPLGPVTDVSLTEPVFTSTMALVHVNPALSDEFPSFVSTKDGRLVFYLFAKEVRVWNSQTKREVHRWQLPFRADAFVYREADERLVFVESDLSAAYTVDGKEVWRTPRRSRGDNRISQTDNGWLLVGDSQLLDAATGREIANLHRVDDGLLVSLPDGHYAASKQGFSAVKFRTSAGLHAFSEFDLELNRPDLVARALGATPGEVKALSDAVQRRRQRQAAFDLGFTRLDLQVTPQTADWRTRDSALTLQLASKDATAATRILTWVNDVPVGAPLPWPTRADGSVEPTASVTAPLSFGPNRVEVAIQHAQARSARRDVYIDRSGTPTPRTTYILSVGTSHYKDSAYDLSYAAKDAADVAKHFAQSRGKSARVILLQNERATQDAIRTAAQTLRQSKVDDEVLVMFAGHGLLDANGDYHYATHETDFADPKTGLSMQAIEALFDGVAARQRVIFLDTCFSGDEAFASVGESERGVREVKTRGVKAKGNPATLVSVPFAFADLRRGIGAAVIASAGGAEYAMESDKWSNGVFTYALLEALKTRRGDRNGDGHLSVSEVKEIVGERVSQLTGGRQRPTSRQDNFSVDFEL